MLGCEDKPSVSETEIWIENYMMVRFMILEEWHLRKNRDVTSKKWNDQNRDEIEPQSVRGSCSKIFPFTETHFIRKKLSVPISKENPKLHTR